MSKPTTADYEEIWLQPRCCADPDEGREWCQDANVWEHDPDESIQHDPCTRYVRADLLKAAETNWSNEVQELSDTITALEAKLEEINAIQTGCDHGRLCDCPCMDLIEQALLKQEQE